MVLAGYKKGDAARIAKNVMKIEKLIADSTWTREESRNLPAMYNVRTIDQGEGYVSPFPLGPLLHRDRTGIQTPETVIVTNINTAKQGDNLMASLSDREKKDLYLSGIRQPGSSLS